MLQQDGLSGGGETRLKTSGDNGGMELTSKVLLSLKGRDDLEWIY